MALRKTKADDAKQASNVNFSGDNDKNRKRSAANQYKMQQDADQSLSQPKLLPKSLTSKNDEQKQMMDEYKQIADLDDIEITPWQRQLRVNKFMLDVGIKKTITELLEPIYEAHQQIEASLQQTVSQTIGGINSRLTKLEDDVYRGESRDDRLSRFDERIAEMERSSKLSEFDRVAATDALKSELEELKLQQSTLHKRFTVNESALESIRATMDVKDKNFKDSVNEVVNKVERMLKLQSEKSGDNHQRIHQFELLISKNSELVYESSLKIETLLSKSAQLELSIDSLFKTAQSLQESKADLKEFNEFTASSLKTALTTRLSLEKVQNQTLTCANYMEKYMPLYIQRQMTDLLEYCFTERSVRWRINWFNEVKVPMLIAGILFDSGHNSLQERVAKLKDLATTTINPPLPGDKKATTADEEYIQLALQSRQMHARAKLVIMQMLNQIGRGADQRIASEKASAVDCSKLSVTQIFEQMLLLLREQSPSTAERIQKQVSDEDVEVVNDEKAMEEDLSIDNSIEARIEREVKKLTEKFDGKIQHQMHLVQDRVIELVKTLQTTGVQEMHRRSDQISEYIQEMHQFQIMEMSHFKDCHAQYLNSAKQFEGKLQAVIGIENNHLAILKQIKTINEIVSELTQAKMTALAVEEPITPSSPKPQQSPLLCRQRHSVAINIGGLDKLQSFEGGLTDLDSKTHQLKHASRKGIRNSIVKNETKVADQNHGLSKDDEIRRPATQQLNKRASVVIQKSPPQLSRGLTNESKSPQFRLSVQTTETNIMTKNLSQTLNKIRNQSVRNINLLSQMIVDNDHEKAAQIAQRALQRAEKSQRPLKKLPSTNQFRRSVEDFRERLQDTKTVNLYQKDAMAGVSSGAKSHIKPIEIKMSVGQSMRLGIMRESDHQNSNTLMKLGDKIFDNQAVLNSVK